MVEATPVLIICSWRSIMMFRNLTTLISTDGDETTSPVPVVSVFIILQATLKKYLPILPHFHLFPGAVRFPVPTGWFNGTLQVMDMVLQKVVHPARQFLTTRV